MFFVCQGRASSWRSVFLSILSFSLFSSRFSFLLPFLLSFLFPFFLSVLSFCFPSFCFAYFFVLLFCAVQAVLDFPALEVIRAGGCYVVSFPSLDEFQCRRKTQVERGVGLQSQASLLVSQDAAHLSVVVFGASGDVAKKKTL